MTPEHEKKIVTDFPKLYRQYDLDMTETCMCWGFECPDEWFSVIYDLSKKITTFMEENNFLVEAAQVKEKYGGLRFYVDFVGDVTDENYNTVFKMIDEAEKKI